ncbi:MAG: hypothetical protein KDB10_16005 [Acidimicrobiales bacterium]|nr:hypothetical protein [Acidimicrobiales bacterium]
MDPGDDDEHRFHHDLIRDVILAGMTAVEREDLHWAIAGLPDLAPRDAADHAVAGATTVGRRMEAARIAVAGGEEALRLLLYTEAVHRFDDALALLEDRPDPSTMARAHIGRSRARYLAGDAPGSYADAAQAVRLSRPQSASLFADSVLALAGTPEDLNIGEYRAEGDCREALDRLPGHDRTRRARLLAVAAIHRWDHAGGRAAVGREFSEALELSRAAGDAATEAFVLRARQRAWFEAAALDERLAAADRLVGIGAETGDDAIRCWGHRWRVIHGFEALAPGQHEALDRFGELADALGDVFHLWGHRLRCAGLALAEGRSEDARRMAGDAEAHARRLGSSLPVAASAQLDRGRRWLWGDPEALVDMHPTGHAAEAHPEGDGGAPGAHASALLVLSGGAPPTGGPAADAAVVPADAALETLNAFELDGLALRAAAGGDRELASTLVDVLEPLAHQWSAVLPGLTALTPLASSLGLALETLGRDDEALLAHREAVASAEAAGAWPAAVHALAHLGRVEGRVNDPEAATTASRAADLADDLGSCAVEMIGAWTLPGRPA